jgi:predicted RNA binding protein with dsRBD fold (UPF0201 family)
MEPAITVSTIVRAHEDPKLVLESVQNIFPDWFPDSFPDSSEFPSNREDLEIISQVHSIDKMLSILRERKVLDTAMDAMAIGIDGNGTKFNLSRQSAFASKVSFIIEEVPLGGLIVVHIEVEDIAIWLEQQTWHSGRDFVPRSTSDDLAMTEKGDPAEWFDSKGRRTMQSD